MQTNNPLLRKAMFEAFRGRCFYSGREVHPQSFAIDHIVPSAKGGKDEIENYVVCDPDINLLKTDFYNEEGVVPVLYIVRTVFAPRVRKVLERLEKEKVVFKIPIKTKPKQRREYKVSDDDFFAVWGVTPQDLRNHVEKNWQPITSKELAELRERLHNS